ncbi:hypothetical protein L3Q82_004541 [Scortum barcoo]|uniref:Uncharacterized protein n=1 Tax=Scortum barcoo TaxID=214431 RepID=A0ACB8VH73_9TELE|nr:hypothetical protein L3Q82_004541 [Scortum barcoo]
MYQSPVLLAGDWAAMAPSLTCHPIHTAPDPNGSSCRVVGLLEDGPMSLLRAGPGQNPWAKAQPPGTRHGEPPPQAWQAPGRDPGTPSPAAAAEYSRGQVVGDWGECAPAPGRFQGWILYHQRFSGPQRLSQSLRCQGDRGGVINKSGAREGGLRARLQANPYRPALPSLFLTNARSLVNKMDEMKLRIVSAKIDSCVAIVTETWLDNNIPDAAVELAGRSLLRAVRTAASEKHRGGGLALYIHNAWCTATNIIATYCFLIWNIWQ